MEYLCVRNNDEKFVKIACYPPISPCCIYTVNQYIQLSTFYPSPFSPSPLSLTSSLHLCFPKLCMEWGFKLFRFV